MAHPIRLVTVLGVLFLIAGCISDDGADGESTEAGSAEATATTAAPTTMAPTSTADSVIWVAFDGRECLVTGLASVPAGSVVAVVATNDSGFEADVRIARVRPYFDQEKTFDEMVELQRAGGGVLWEDLSDVAASPMNWLAEEARSFDRERLVLASNLREHQSVKAYRLGNMMGEAVVCVATEGDFDPDHLMTPEGYWFCAPFMVTALEF